MITMGFNKDDLARISSKIKKIQDNARNGSLQAVIQAVSEDYKIVVTAKMGTINARNSADPVFKYGDVSATTHWAELGPNTIRRKENKGWTSAGMVSFWYATGDAKSLTDAVRLEGFRAPQVVSYFAGIRKGIDREVFNHALRTEFGALGPGSPEFPARGLFSIANEVFIRNKDRIMDKVRKALLNGVNWGSR